MHPKFFLLAFICLILRGIPLYADNRAPSFHFERIGPFGGDVRSLLIDASAPENIYLGASNGKIYKSGNAGKSWNVLSPGIEQPSYVIDKLVQHPSDPAHIYACAWDLDSEQGGLFESKDSGATWTRVKLPNAFSAVRGIALCRSKPTHILVATSEGAFISSDGGLHWAQTGDELLRQAKSVAIDPVDPRILYVGTWRLSYVSRDAGKSWTRIEKGMPLDSDIFSITINPKDPSIVFSSACSGVYRSDNRAESWTRLKVKSGTDPFTIRSQVVYIDPSDVSRIYVGTTEGLLFSRDDGHSWTMLTSKDITVNTIQVNPRNPRKILLGTEYHGILSSNDGGATWEQSNEGFIHKQISWMTPDREEKGSMLAGLHSGGGGWYRYRDNRWEPQQIEPGMRVLSFLILPGTAGRLAGTQQGIFLQKSKGAPWMQLKGAIAMRAIYSLEIDPGHPVVYAGTDQGIYRAPLDTLDFRIPPANRLNPKVWRVIAPSVTQGNIYAGTSLGLMRSQDRGTTWKIISAKGLPDRVTIYSIAVSPANQERFFAGTSAGLFESVNGGIAWHRSDTGNIGADISSVLFLDADGQRILAADRSFGGVFYSGDGGVHWDKIFSPDFASPVYSLMPDPTNHSRIYIGTRNEGIYRLTIN